MQLADFQNKILMLDGGMGTVLQQRGLPPGGQPELLNLTEPDLIRSVHRAYIDAGSQVIYTNTFGANRNKLARTGHSVDEIIRAAVRIAREAAGADALVALDIGPLGELLEPMGSLPFEDAYDLFREIAEAGAAAGADLAVIETMTDLYETKAALLACKVKRELGMEPLPHMTCRDRNLNATKALLLGLSMEGVHNVLLVTGDPIPTEERDEVKSVFNFNSRKLARYVTSLNSTVLTSPFRVFGALDLNAKNFDIELRRAQEKEENGVVGFLTQPVLSAEALENLKRARETLQGKLLGGIFPVVSHRNACFLNNEISGMRVCDEIIDLYAGKDRDEAEALAVTISTRIAQEITPYTDGLYIMTPFRRVELIKKIIEAL